MPQLMPLFWISSSIMIGLILVFLIGLYYILGDEFFMSGVNIEENQMAWCW